jgi:O-antigen ligase
MVVTVPFLLWITRRHFIKTVIVGLIAVVCALWFVALMDPVLGGKLIPFMEKSYQGIIKPAEDPTGSWRFYGWRWEMEKIFSNPFWVLIGQGFGGYYEWFFSYHDEIIRTAPHNFYVQLWSKMGLLGLGLFCAAFFSFYVQAFRFLRRSRNDLHRSVIMVFMLSLLSALAAMVAGHAPAGVWVLAALGTTLTRLWLLEAEASPPSVIGVNLPWAKSSVGLRSPGGPLAAAMSGAAKTK